MLPVALVNPSKNRGTRVAVGLLFVALATAAAAQTVNEAPLELKFASFFRQPIGPRGLELSDSLRAADGHRVRLVGYMVAQEQSAPGRFMLTPRPVRMSEHADGEADDLPPATVAVLLDKPQSDRVVAHQPGLMALTGLLQVGRQQDAATGRVSWVRLLLDPHAMAESRLEVSPGRQTERQADTPTHAH